MTLQQQTIDHTIQAMAEEQVMFLRSRYKMDAADIINLYTGTDQAKATYGDAILSVMAFNRLSANQYGFIAA